MKRFLVMLLIAAVVGLPVAVSAAMPERVSIIQLIVDPGAYDGKQVRVVGYARLKGEYAAVYLGEQDGAHEVYQNGISLELANKQDLKRAPQLDRRYVYIEGVFHASVNTEGFLFSGTIDNITRFELWKD